ncbi:HNH endonuclease signature motif containing protein, partial [Pseudomonas amygdali]
MPHIDHETLLKLAHYDPGSGVFTRLSSGREMGRPDRKGYLLSTLRGSSFRLHRLAWYYMKGVWPADEIDHINGRPGDNRWSNLRECSHQENNHNQPLRRNNTSGVKGVYRNKNG